MSYVDMMGNDRWSEEDHVARVEAWLRGPGGVSHVREHVIIRRVLGLTFYLFGQILPDGAPNKAMFQQFGQTLSDAAIAELMQQAQAYLGADVLAAEARADAALLGAALDYEDARTALAALPPAPTDGGEDLDAEQRAQLQAVLDGAAQDALDLVALRDARRQPPQEPAP